MKILLIEDDLNIISFLYRNLKEDNHILESTDDGENGEYLAQINHYDIIIIDWMLPNKTGIEIIKSLRQNDNSTPIIMLTSKNMLQDKIDGIKTGADDYITKPFEYDELLVRLEALHRRNINKGKNIIKIKNLSIDIEAKIVYKDHKQINLTSKEYELLLFFIKYKNSFITTQMIEEQLWDSYTYINSNVISVTLHHLRKKIGKDFISTNRGLGYKLEI